MAAVYTAQDFNSYLSFINRIGEVEEHEPLEIQRSVMLDDKGDNFHERTEWNSGTASATQN